MRQLAVTFVVSGLFVLSKYMTGGTFSHIEPLKRHDTNRWEIHGHVAFINAGSAVKCASLFISPYVRTIRSQQEPHHESPAVFLSN